jgi:hypothetical protein
MSSLQKILKAERYRICTEKAQIDAVKSLPEQTFPRPLTGTFIGPNIGDTYIAKLHAIVFNQGLVVTPSFNTPSAYSALATAGLTFPVYKRLGFNLSALDDFLNDPAFGSKKNSFQFSAGISYALK